LIKGGAQGSVIANTNTSGCGTHTDGRIVLPGFVSGESNSRIDITATGDMIGFVANTTITAMDGIVFIAD
jgi:hypothetical protein